MKFIKCIHHNAFTNISSDSLEMCVEMSVYKVTPILVGITF